ncbi:MAG: RdgB/HAM1 family non-canonical purine NTP pyrophosphatase [Oligoflexia bacterium]|nr:RdgB/HAM1 family non-canonical purine NTP pyrophosphatase [Oligoflexia bacterium]
MRLSNKIVIATQNRSKFDEFKALFNAYPEIELARADQLIRNADLLRFGETFDTYLANALAKARLAGNACHHPVIADDSGLEVEGIGWKPGVRSFRYAEARPGVPQDQANNERLLKELGPNKSRQARFTCTLVLLMEGILLHATGVLEGTIAEAPRGENGFGYDPLFIPRGSTKTFAEMSDGEKNSISHRGKALHELMSQVKTHGIVFVKP